MLKPRPCANPGTRGYQIPTITPTPTPATVPCSARHFPGKRSPTPRLQRCDFDAILTTTITGSDGSYAFEGISDLEEDQIYYVRFGPNGVNNLYLRNWYGPDITSYAADTSVHGGDFDIKNIHLRSPDAFAKVTLPVTFTWDRREIPTDTYAWYLFKSGTADTWTSDNLGDSDNYLLDALPEGVDYDSRYFWAMLVYTGPDSFGISYDYNMITFLSSTAQDPPRLFVQDAEDWFQAFFESEKAFGLSRNSK